MKLIYIIISIFLVLIAIVLNNYNDIKIWILNRLIVLRGIISPNRFWYKISDLVLSDGSGVNLYNDLKKENKDFTESEMFGKKIYIVTNEKYIRIILDNSPNLFQVGEFKKIFFKSFMSKNVGVSSGCPWAKRRKINETALDTDRLHRYYKKYDNDIYKYLKNWEDQITFEFEDFYNFGKYIVAKIVFNVDHIDDKVYEVFSEANTLEVFVNSNFKIEPDIYDKYLDTLNYYIENPQPKSLIDLCLKSSQNKEDILHQIPHFMFPIISISVSVIPRLLVLLFNHKDVLQKVIEEINSVNDNSHLFYLRKCILESVRLNNLVITTFRTLSEDFSFDKEYSFEKGDQFLILNNPVLRETEYFENPNEFIPERWTEEMEKSYYALSFGQGPQRCPGKDLSIYLCQSFIYNFFKIKNINKDTIIKTNKLDTTNIPQIINPFSIKIQIN